MSLAPGVRLGAYEVVGLIGAGGMGEVYRARDTRLDRDVAIKIIPGEFTGDGQRVERFEQEARAAAALNHPNILAVFDVGTHAPSAAPAIPYVVSELLKGGTLRERLAAGPLPVRKAIEYAIQLAHGLTSAHEKNIVHRDLKPDNIFITDDGRVKILDFGLAKLIEPDAAMSGLSNLPTTPPKTQAGIVLGTVGYMSPEQVRGLPADHRADIFAFGVVLYEMLSAERAFQRETGFETMTAIVKEDPPTLPLADRHIPPGVARIVDRCLEKNAAHRFQSASDLAFALEAMSTPSESVRAVDSPTKQKSARWVAWSAGAVLGLLAAFALPVAVVHLREADNPSDVVRFSITPPPGSRFENSFVAPFPEVSPDGRHLAFVAIHGDRPHLWVRALESFEARVLPGTEDAALPFWSPDGRTLAFFADGKLKRVDASGSDAHAVCDAPGPAGGTWGADDVILFGLARGVIQQVPASGGLPVPVTKLDASRNEVSHRWPSFLPDGRRFLYESRGTVFMASLDAPAAVHLLDADSKAVYVNPGHILFVRDGTLLQQAFDASAARLFGDARPIAHGVRFNPSNGRAAFSASERVLVYRTGSDVDSELVWLDRRGNRLATLGDAASYTDVELSPDGRHAAVTIGRRAEGASHVVWIFDTARGIRTRLTFGDFDDFAARWSPDGSDVFFARRLPKPSLYSKHADGSGSEQQRLELTTSPYADDVSPDGRFLLYEIQSSATDWDIWALPLSGGGKARPIVEGPFRQEYARFSPDGRWITYRSNESGRYEVYVAAFPGAGGKRQVSTSGGDYPRWSRDGREIFYVDASDRIVSAAVRHRPPAIEIDEVTPLFELGDQGLGSLGLYPYDVSPDGMRILVNTRLQRSTSEPLSVVINWSAVLAPRD